MPERPNIVLITSDQHRADSMGCAGHPCVRTSHLDVIASEGVRFDRAYVDCPVCIPARTTLVTGIQSHRYGRPAYAQDYRINRAPDRFLGSLITRAGYQTELVGKRHWHTEPSFRGGFEHVVPEWALHRERERRGFPPNAAGIGNNEFNPRLSPYPPDLCFTNWAVTHACEFLRERDRTQPFFLWVSTIDPHPPNIVHEPYYSMYDHETVPEPLMPEWCRDVESLPYALAGHRLANGHRWLRPSEVRKARGVYYGMITNIDDQLGRLFGALVRERVWDNTWIIYTSDHGDHLGDYGDWSKSTFLDPATRVPLIIRPPKSASPAKRGVVSDAVVQWADLLPTLCAIAGAETPGDIDGTSLLDLALGGGGPVREELHCQIGQQHMLLYDRWKYLYFAEDGREMLFDTVADPRDTQELSSRRDLVEPLRRRLIDHLTAEGNTACENGELVNLGRTITDAERTASSGWMGWVG